MASQVFFLLASCTNTSMRRFFMLFCSYATMTSFYVAVVIFSGFVATIVERRPIEFTFVEFEYVVVFCLMMAVTVVLTGFTVYIIYI